MSKPHSQAKAKPLIATPRSCADCRFEVAAIEKLDDGRELALCWNCSDDRFEARMRPTQRLLAIADGPGFAQDAKLAVGTAAESRAA